jgi:hypothetical protein
MANMARARMFNSRETARVMSTLVESLYFAYLHASLHGFSR